MSSTPEMRVLGLMSGTSCDGLDIALCRFSGSPGSPDFELLQQETVSYSPDMENRLQQAIHLGGLDLIVLENEWTRFVAKCTSDFLERNKERADLIGFHGHTVFHQPQHGFTFQMGNGAALAVLTGIETICDFRRPDVAAEGQGAPLVPIGEKQLFTDFNGFLNIGGFANVSFRREDGSMRAFDIVPANLHLNRYTRLLNQPFDFNGRLAAKGKVSTILLKKLNDIEYYNDLNKGSLGLEWAEKEVFPITDEWLHSVSKGENITEHLENAIATITEHIAGQIGSQLLKGKVMVTGGGAKNSYLMERIRFYSHAQLHIPGENLIDFKEAIIFAYLAYLRYFNLPNTLPSVTHATRSISAGAHYLP